MQFHANPFQSFSTKFLTEKQTDKQQRLHILLGGGKDRQITITAITSAVIYIHLE